MTDHRMPRFVSSGLAFALAAFVASAATVDKYAGVGPTIAYGLVLCVLGPAAFAAYGLCSDMLTTQQAVALAALTIVTLVVVFLVVYPHANSHAPGTGSDRDDAADLGGRALLDGRFPYRQLTYLGNPISQFPGGLVFAAPFVLLGHSAYAGLAWCSVLLVLLWKVGGQMVGALWLFCLSLVLSPAFVRELVTGGDLIANTVAVMLAAWLIAEAAAGRRGRAVMLLGAAALGLALSWRLNFVFVLGPLVVHVWRLRGARVTAVMVLVTAAAFAAVTLPFYLPHLHSFPPIAEGNKLAGYDGVIPGGAGLVVAVGAVLSLALPAWRPPARVDGVFGQTAVVQAFFVMAVAALASEHSSSLDLRPLVPGYGLPVLLLALGGLVTALEASRASVGLLTARLAE